MKRLLGAGRIGLGIWMLVVLGSWLAVAQAHEIRPAIVTVAISDTGKVEVRAEVNLEALLAGIEPQHQDTKDAPQAAQYNALRAAEPNVLQAQYTAYSPRYAEGVQLLADGETIALVPSAVEIPEVGDTRRARLSEVILLGQLPEDSQGLQFAYAPEFGNAAVKFSIRGEPPQKVHWLTDGALSPAIAVGAGANTSSAETGSAFWSYIKIGFEHIIPKGLDHILFVLGLFLLSTRWQTLLSQVTAFTLAHTLTLALSIYGVVAVSPSWVEPLIALSIAYVGIENIVRGQNSASRLLLVFIFGLLHGLGFSGVLSEIGLPEEQFASALIGFNIGVELGQIAVIALALATVIVLRLKNHARYRQWVVIPGSLAISAVGLYWFFERIGG